MNLPLPYYASRLMSLPNTVAGYSNTRLRRLQETFDEGQFSSVAPAGYAACSPCGTARAIPSRPTSQMNAASSRATAMIATCALFPLARSLRKRRHNLSCASQARSRLSAWVILRDGAGYRCSRVPDVDSSKQIQPAAYVHSCCRSL